MRYLCALLAWLLLSAFTATNVGTNANTSGATLAVTLGSGVTGSSTTWIWVCVDEHTSSLTIGPIADSRSNTYHAFQNNTLTNNNATLFYANVATSLIAGDTITFTKAVSGDRAAMSVLVVSPGVDPGIAGNSAGGNATGTSSTPSAQIGVNAGPSPPWYLIGCIGTGGNAGTFTQALSPAAWSVPFNEAKSGTTSSDARVDGGFLSITSPSFPNYAPTFSVSVPWIDVGSGVKQFVPGTGGFIFNPNVIP